ncbi:PAS domain S-box protein [Leptospira levettii]|uniref:PAS domain S-box protein n=1 Tax=Leptospira levettii TaxID=2023178 RepID=UPI0010831F09|nr:PAS domain S-box protein [Leptospira levettii]MCW7496672.1 PAS domain S-box protein [Leptospira levettii]MCW7506950.1 PAS domain S-box protein [Leptospira levettii]MCW7518040.1 PAS domain S-box protein [Leptospira levettii]TGK99559.1 PAS domain S-box protein [Leptospira levettii]TGM75683.1 PAS domain S-box protein [Leptospira levettii]
MDIKSIIGKAVDESISAIAISEPLGKIIFVNNAFLDFLGYTSKDEVVGRFANEFWIPSDHENNVTVSLTKTGSYFGELEAVKKNKSILNVVAQFSISRSLSNEIEYIIFSFLESANRKSITDSIRETENYFSQILDSISDLIFCKDSKFKMTYVNKACADYLGLKKSDLIGTYDIPENKQEFIEEYHKIDSFVFQEGKQVKIEKEPHLGKDGLVRYFNTVKTPIRDQYGNINELVAVARDITDSEDILGKLKLITEITSDYIYTAKIINGEIIADWSSGNLSKIVGYTVEDIGNIGGWINIIHPDDIGKIENRVAEILQGHVGVSEYRVLAKSGEVVWIRDYSKPLYDEFGKLSKLIGASKNITIEKEVETKLKESNERFKASLEASLESIYFLSIVKDNHGTIIDFTFNEMNEKGSINLGVPKEELIGKRICELYPINLENGFFEQYKEVFLTKQPLEQEYTIPDGYYTPGYFHHIVLPTTDGVVIYNRNISDRVAKNKELETLVQVTNRQNERLREYTYITSHNLRAPIANILSLCNLLKDDPGDQVLVQMIESSAQQLDHMMNNLNELLTIEKDSHSFVKKEIHLKKEIQNQLLLYVSDKSNQTKVDVIIPNDLVLYTIPVYFESIVNNVLSNAFKYISQKSIGYIRIETKESEEFIILSITDNGIGIDLEKYRSKMFKMNSRFHPNIEGKGMGLFLTKYQIESLGGKIEVESQVGKETSFHLYFPKMQRTNV